MGTCKLQAGALIASAFFFTLPLGLSASGAEAAAVGGAGAVTDQAAASKTLIPVSSGGPKPGPA